MSYFDKLHAKLCIGQNKYYFSSVLQVPVWANAKLALSTFIIRTNVCSFNRLNASIEVEKFIL